jgi:hypothetical protein
MQDHALRVSERLAAWRKQYAPELGQDVVDQATAFAAECYLAFDVRNDPRLEGVRWDRVPAAAIISHEVWRPAGISPAVGTSCPTCRP